MTHSGSPCHEKIRVSLVLFIFFKKKKGKQKMNKLKICFLSLVLHLEIRFFIFSNLTKNFRKQSFLLFKFFQYFLPSIHPLLCVLLSPPTYPSLPITPTYISSYQHSYPYDYIVHYNLFFFSFKSLYNLLTIY